MASNGLPPPATLVAADGIAPPTNPMASALLTDLYQFTMAYTYWKARKHLDRAVFDLYFRRNPFGGEFTVFAGLEECIRFTANFKLKEDEIAYLRTVFPSECQEKEEFFNFLRELDCSDVQVYAIPEGSVVFPKVPLVRVEGPIAWPQMLLGIVLLLGNPKCFLSLGCEEHSNVAAGRLFGIPLRGTHSHAFVSSFMSLDEVVGKSLSSQDNSDKCEDFVGLVQSWLTKLQRSSSLSGIFGETNQSELAAFTSYALAFPNNFLALVDTYDI